MHQNRLNPRPAEWWRGIAPGSKVWFKTPQGAVLTGRAVICTPTHVTLNTGGQHGTPKVVDDGNYVKHTAPKIRKAKV